MNTKIEALQSKAHQLIHLGDKEGVAYADDLSRLNREVHELINVLWNKKGKTVEEEARICLVLLMGYSVSMYANPSDVEKRQCVIDRACSVLEKLPAGLLKCQLLVEAKEIMKGWSERELNEQEKEVVALDVLKVVEG